MTRKDIIGNEIKSECVGCAIVRGEVKLPGGIIYDGESIILAADPEIPIPGLLFCHGTPYSNNAKLLPDNDSTDELLLSIPEKYVICGHTHVQR